MKIETSNLLTILFLWPECVRFVSPSVRLQTKKLEMFAKESLSSALAPSYLDTGTTRILSSVGKLSRGPGSFHSCYCISRYLVFADKGQKKLFSLVENLGSKDTRFPEREWRYWEALLAFLESAARKVIWMKRTGNLSGKLSTILTGMAMARYRMGLCCQQWGR